MKLGIGNSYSLINGTLCETGYRETFYFLFFGLSIKTSCRAALCRATVQLSWPCAEGSVSGQQGGVCAYRAVEEDHRRVLGVFLSSPVHLMGLPQ